MTSQDSSSHQKLAQRVEKLGIGNLKSGHSKHIFLCTGESCTGRSEGEKSWDHLKSKLAEMGLSPGAVYRTKVGCLRLCTGGPVGLVYPDGTWYHGLTPRALDRVIEEHLVGGCPVEEFRVASHPLTDEVQNSNSSSSSKRSD